MSCLLARAAPVLSPEFTALVDVLLLAGLRTPCKQDDQSVAVSAEVCNNLVSPARLTQTTGPATGAGYADFRRLYVNRT